MFFDANGLPGFPIELKSNSSGVQASISKSSENVCAQYLYLTDLNAIGGATFYAGLGSDDVSNNAGWNFNANNPCLTMIKNIRNNNPTQLYPNPTNGTIQISNATDFVNSTIKITSIDGALVYENQNLTGNNLAVDLSKEANGIYFIQLIDKNTISNFKIVKN